MINLEEYYAPEPEKPPLRKCGITEGIMNKRFDFIKPLSGRHHLFLAP